MKKITFNCETITPLFLGEAKKEAVELRPPAIKAAMRFWWRAAHSHLTLPVMKNLEADIFGGGGNEAKSAKFDIVLSEPSLNPISYKYPPHNSSDAIAGINMGTITGSQYLMYTFIYLKKKGQYFPQGTTFNISFYFDNDTSNSNQVLASFWLLVFFGNIGERARRGFGSFKVTSISDNNSLLGQFNFTNYTLEAITAGMKLIRNPEVFNITRANSTTVNKNYSHILNKEMYISDAPKPFETWQMAMDDIGTKMYDFRLRNKDRTIAEASGHLKANKSAIFGLPIKHRTGSTVMPRDNDFQRRASPLIIKIIQVAPNGYRWVLTKLGGDFLPIGRNSLNIGGTADNAILDMFLSTL